MVGWVAIGAVGLIAAAPASERWGPFRGQVVDLETGEPIPGAVALAVWWKIRLSFVHGTREFYDAREAVTGPDGAFEIPRLLGPLWILGVQPAEITLFAPGYKWQATVVTPPDGQRFVAPTIVQMRRLKTREELLKKDDSADQSDQRRDRHAWPQATPARTRGKRTTVKHRTR